MKQLSLYLSLICILLAGCQQHIEFTLAAEPKLPDFNQPSNLPTVKPNWELITKQERVISKIELSNTKQPITVMQIKSHPSDVWELKLVAINATNPLANVDVLVSAFRRKAVSMLIDKQNECVESINPSAGYHSIAIDMKCSNFKELDARLLGQFWRNDFADDIDVDTIRRNLKLNRKIQSVTGSDINRVFEEHLLGTNHPYLKVAQDRSFFEDLSRNKLQQLQSATAAKLTWFLLVKAPQTLSKNRLTKLANEVTEHMAIESEETKSINLEKLKAEKQTQTIYFIDAPDSKDIKVRIGVRFPQYFVNGKPVDSDNGDWQKQQKSEFACKTLSGILGRGSYGPMALT